MPIYEYKCNNNHVTERLVIKVSDNVPAIVKCDKCDEEAKRIVSQSRFKLKGNCWASDNYTRN